MNNNNDLIKTEEDNVAWLLTMLDGDEDVSDPEELTKTLRIIKLCRHVRFERTYMSDNSGEHLNETDASLSAKVEELGRHYNVN